MLTNFKGKLLVAKPQQMRDPRFTESVIYIYEQSNDVVLGLMLNKKSRMTLAELHSMRGYHNSGACGYLYKGGPVSEQSLLLLHTDDWYSSNTMQITHGNAISSDELMLEKMVSNNMPKDWRLMSGISTWSLQQLQTEIYKFNAWLVVEPDSSIFYLNDGDEQWNSAIALASTRMVENFF
jgi:putative AlgH/UPF0301 family transcriptional regulator